MASDGAEEFVEGWLVAQVLGEGAYGEVRLLVHAGSGACVALKSVRCADDGGARSAAAKREAALHRPLRHAHVLRCLGARHHPPQHYMFLEYAQGGELFDRIEPDVGCGAAAARRYWAQLLAGLAYLHARGVAHRDIKPENLLLDLHDNIKISDFGMATIFRHGSRERLLSRVCGTVPYAAPEVLACARAPPRPHRAPPADLWAAAVVLVAMLTGELPWERAEACDVRFAAWCGAGGAVAPGGVWRKVWGAGAGAGELVGAALAADPAARPALDLLLQHEWVRRADSPPAARLADAVDGGESAERGWCSQPARRCADDGDGALSPACMDALISFSQPALPDDVLLPTQHTQGGAGAGGGVGVMSRLVRRLTRVWVRAPDTAGALRAVAGALTTRHVPHAYVHPTLLSIEWGEVCMRAWAVGAVGGAVLVEFRRARGCGLRFKRRYLELRAALAPLAAPPPHAPLDAPPPHVPPDAPMDLT